MRTIIAVGKASRGGNLTMRGNCQECGFPFDITIGRGVKRIIINCSQCEAGLIYENPKIKPEAIHKYRPANLNRGQK